MAGGERMPAIILITLVLCIIVGAIPGGIATMDFLFACFAGAILWIVGINVLRTLAKADPQMISLYLRHIKYRSFYPATQKRRLNSATNWRMTIGFK
jgi:type IV secretory pathway TrbD component